MTDLRTFLLVIRYRRVSGVSGKFVEPCLGRLPLPR